MNGRVSNGLVPSSTGQPPVLIKISDAIWRHYDVYIKQGVIILEMPQKHIGDVHELQVKPIIVLPIVYIEKKQKSCYDSLTLLTNLENVH